jgi:hypothetical protein
MADTKISALTSASTPLAGTEVLPIVQSSATVKVAVNDLTVQNIRSNATTGILQITGPAAASTRVATVPNANWTAARTDAAQSFTGDQTLSTGNIIQGTAAKGFNFTANTPAAGMTSQLLNWYEAGTWTPSDSSGASLSFTQNSTAKYTRNGSLVTATFDISYPSTASGSNAIIGGLPFSGTANTGGLVTVYTSYSYLITGPVNSGTTINLYANSGTGSSQLTNVLLSSKRIMAVITYLV